MTSTLLFFTRASIRECRKDPLFQGSPQSGTDSLVQSVLDSGLGTDSNVYAELGSTWQVVMREPDQAAHMVGKLLKYIGENNVLWGHGLPVLRFSPGSDPGLQIFPDLGGVPGKIRLPENHRRDSAPRYLA